MLAICKGFDPACGYNYIRKGAVVRLEKRADYTYEIWRNIRFENENAFTVEITRYNRQGEITENNKLTA